MLRRTFTEVYRAPLMLLFRALAHLHDLTRGYEPGTKQHSRMDTYTVLLGGGMVSPVFYFAVLEVFLAIERLGWAMRQLTAVTYDTTPIKLLARGN